MRTLTDEKRDQILRGALEVFQASGYDAASVSEIARVAGVSKPTIYNYFPGKAELFSACLLTRIEAYASKILELELAGAPHDVLTRLGHAVLELTVSPGATHVYRWMVAESGRFPDLAESFYDRGPGKGAAKLADYLTQAQAQGTLALGDTPALDAARMFIDMFRGEVMLRNLFGMAPLPDADALVTYAVDLFLRAYGR